MSGHEMAMVDCLANRCSPPVDVDHGGNDVMRGIGGGAEWEQREYPNRLVRRPSAPNGHG
jgi:hypothetical protein